MNLNKPLANKHDTNRTIFDSYEGTYWLKAPSAINEIAFIGEPSILEKGVDDDVILFAPEFAI